MNMQNELTKKPSLFVQKLGVKAYIRSRLLSPKQIIYGFLHYKDMFNKFSVGNALFCARYNAGPSKCIEGYDFY